MPNSIPTASPSRLGHSLKPRQLIMMGLGSAIGAGLFLGSGVGVKLAGPAVLVSYLFAGALVIIVMNALGEMAAAKPSSGAFSVYAADAFGLCQFGRCYLDGTGFKAFQVKSVEQFKKKEEP